MTRPRNAELMTTLEDYIKLAEYAENLLPSLELSAYYAFIEGVPAMAKALIEAEENIRSVSNKLEFMALAAAGDPAQQDMMKMHAILAGSLQQSLATIQRLRNGGV